MRATLRLMSKIVLAAASLAVMAGCVATPGYGGSSIEVGYSVGFYEPAGYVYGDWPSSYHVAPPRPDHDRNAYVGASHPGRSPSRPAYRPAPPSRQLPSLPNRPRPRPH